MTQEKRKALASAIARAVEWLAQVGLLEQSKNDIPSLTVAGRRLMDGIQETPIQDVVSNLTDALSDRGAQDPKNCAEALVAVHLNDEAWLYETSS